MCICMERKRSFVLVLQIHLALGASLYFLRAWWKIQNSNNSIWEPVKDADSGIHSRLTESENLATGISRACLKRAL